MVQTIADTVQAIKYSADGKQMLALGVALVPGNDDSHFCKPTGVSTRSLHTHRCTHMHACKHTSTGRHRHKMGPHCSVCGSHDQRGERCACYRR